MLNPGTRVKTCHTFECICRLRPPPPLSWIPSSIGFSSLKTSTNIRCAVVGTSFTEIIKSQKVNLIPPAGKKNLSA